MRNILVIIGVLFPSLLLCDLRPVPWLTEGAIAFLEQFLDQHPEAKVLEFGSGASTLWLSQRVSVLVSIEHSTPWYQTVQKALKRCGKRHVRLMLASLPYYTVCDQFPPGYFDLILIDGRYRRGCICHSIPILKRGGVLMLDNSERSYYKEGIDLIRGWEGSSALQASPDSCGFWYPGWTTSWWKKP